MMARFYTALAHIAVAMQTVNLSPQERTALQAEADRVTAHLSKPIKLSSVSDSSELYFSVDSDEGYVMRVTTDFISISVDVIGPGKDISLKSELEQVMGNAVNLVVEIPDNLPSNEIPKPETRFPGLKQ